MGSYRFGKVICQLIGAAWKQGDEQGTYFQLTHAARTHNGSQRTSLCLYINRKFVGRRLGFNASSPCLIVHCSFSTVTSISPSIASTLVLPESRHAKVAIVSWLSRMCLRKGSGCQPIEVVEMCTAAAPTYFSIVRKTFRRWLKVVFAHSCWASVAFTTALSIPSRVAGLIWPSDCPLAGL